jgi:small subunit ribosomal protein S5
MHYATQELLYKGVIMAKVKETELNTVTPEPEATEVAEDVIVTPDEGTTPAAMEERVISVDRVSRTQKGGRRMRFRALVVVGDRQGNVGIGVGKSNEITAAVAKATYNAKKHIVSVPIVRHTIPHEIVSKFDTAKVLLKPAAVGTSIIAGGSVRPILELAGVENVVGKCLTRTTNKLNNAYATLEALRSLKNIKELAPRPYRKVRKPKAAAPEIQVAS